MQKNVIYRWLKRNFLQHISVISITACCVVLLGYRLLTVHTSPNGYEATAINRLNDLRGLLNNPLDFLYLILAKLISFVTSDLSALKITSVVFTLVTIFNIRYVLKFYTESRTANIGTLLMSTSFWVLIFGRVGAPLIMPAFWLSSLFSILAWRTYTTKIKLSNTLLIAIIAFGIYTPVFAWVIIGILGIYFNKNIKEQLLSKLKNLYAPLLILFLTPLFYALIKNPSLSHSLLGIKDFSPSPISYMSSLVQNFAQIFVKGGVDHSISLGKQPFLDAFQGFMMIIGIIMVLSNKMLWLPIIIVAFISVGGLNITALSVLIPMVFLLVAIGFSEFLNLWLKSFPKNPYGRSLGLFLCVTLVGMSSYYNTHKYFVAWAKSPDVQSAHNLKQ
jgi:hypothetical protein